MEVVNQDLFFERLQEISMLIRAFFHNIVPVEPPDKVGVGTLTLRICPVQEVRLCFKVCFIYSNYESWLSYNRVSELLLLGSRLTFLTR